MKLYPIAIGFAVAGLLAATAVASTKHYKTTLDSFAVAANPPAPDTYIEYGQVHSTKKACRSNRKIKLVAAYADGSHKVLDSGRSSKNGAYSMLVDFNGAESGTIKAAAKRFGPKGHRSVCNAGSVQAD